MDKMTNGFVTVPEGQEANVQLDIKRNFEEQVLREFGIKAKVKVKLVPIEQIIENVSDRLNFTHGYTVRIRG